MPEAHRSREGVRSSAAIRALALLLALVTTTSCVITYRDFPVAAMGQPPESKPYDTLYYDIVNVRGFFGGDEALREVFRSEAPFARTEISEEIPKRGVYCRVETQKRSPSIGSAIAAYASYVFLFAIPFWSLQEGYYVRYHLFVDGQEKKIFEYDITRKAVFWIGLLPITWVNAFTYSEKDAFRATAYRFFQEAAPHIGSARGIASTRH